MTTRSSSSRVWRRKRDLDWADVINRLSLDKGVSEKVLQNTERDDGVITPRAFLEVESDTQACFVQKWGITGWAPALVHVINEVSHILWY